MSSLGQMIRGKRKQIKVTLEGLHKMTGISKGYLCDIENGRHGEIGFLTIIVIGNILGISIDRLQDAYLYDIFPDCYPEYIDIEG